MSVPNLLGLSGLITMVPYDKETVLTLLQDFWYDPSSTATVDGITVVSASKPGRWLRDPAPAPTWTAKTAWYQDAVTGNDENVGDAASPVKTIAEIARRLRRIDGRAYKIYQMSDVPSSDSLRFAPELSESGTAFSSAQAVASILITGEKAKKVDVTGTLGPATKNTDPTSNTQATAAASGITWSAFVGRLLSVPAKRAQAIVLKEVAPGVARVSEWVDPVSGAPVTSVPVAGDTYEIMKLPELFAPILYAGLPSRVELNFQDIIVSSNDAGVGRVIPSACTTVFTSCVFTVPMVGPPQGFPFDCFLRACSAYFKSATNFCQTSVGNGPRFAGCGLINARIQISTHGRTGTTDTVIQGGAIRGVDKVPSGRVFGGLFVVAGRLGIFDSPASESAITLRRGMTMHVQEQATLYGDGNALFGVEVSEGSCLAIQKDVLPSLKGASGELQLEGATDAIPELGGKFVPKALALQTWAQWDGPTPTGFGRNVLNYKTGSKIITVI
ncbi:MAG: hypothetical protein ABI969_08645 [bacterium]